MISCLLLYACLFYHPAVTLLRYVSIELKELLTYLQQNRLRWYEHVLRKEDWEKKCM